MHHPTTWLAPRKVKTLLKEDQGNIQCCNKGLDIFHKFSLEIKEASCRFESLKMFPHPYNISHGGHHNPQGVVVCTKNGEAET